MPITPIPGQLLFSGPFATKGDAKNMKTIALLALALTAISTLRAEIVTLTAYDDYSGPKYDASKLSTESIEITREQTITLLSIVPYYAVTPTAQLWVTKNEHRVYYAPSLYNAQPQPPFVIKGPAKITLATERRDGAVFATFQITPERVDPTQTVIVYPGTNNAAKVTMLCSTNLADWSPATNGLYSGDVAKFFRIGIEKKEN